MKIGALTSKVHAFKSRPWEFKSYDSMDFLDGLGNPVRLEVRGSEIMRILPRRADNISEEWITDKIRFIADGIKKQRLQRPFYRVWIWDNKSGFNDLFPTTWQYVLQYIKKYENYSLSIEQESEKYKSNNLHFDVVVGQFVDLETQVSAKKFFSHFSSNFLSINGYSNMLSDFRSLYYLQDGLQKLENAEVVIFCGVNMLKEYPILNLRVLKNMSKKVILSFGNRIGSGYYIGNTTKSFVDFLSGNSFLSKCLTASKSIVFVFGNSFIEFFPRFFDYLSDFNKFLSNINKNIEISHVNCLIGNISDAGALDLGLYAENNKVIDPKHFNVLYLLDADFDAKIDGFYSLYDYDMVVYQGHHGDKLVEEADVVLPGVIPFEKTSHFLTILGESILNKFVLTPKGDVRVDWKILNGLKANFNLPFYDNNEELLLDIVEKYNFILNQPLYSVSNGLLSSAGLLVKNREIKLNSVFNLGKKDVYYRSDSITRNSYLLMLASKRILSKRKIWK